MKFFIFIFAHNGKRLCFTTDLHMVSADDRKLHYMRCCVARNERTVVFIKIAKRRQKKIL